MACSPSWWTSAVRSARTIAARGISNCVTIGAWLRITSLAGFFTGGSFLGKHPEIPSGPGGTATFKFQQSAGRCPDTFSATITYNSTNVTLQLYDEAGGSCPGANCFTYTWQVVNIPGVAGGPFYAKIPVRRRYRHGKRCKSHDRMGWVYRGNVAGERSGNNSCRGSIRAVSRHDTNALTGSGYLRLGSKP